MFVSKLFEDWEEKVLRDKMLKENTYSIGNSDQSIDQFDLPDVDMLQENTGFSLQLPKDEGVYETLPNEIDDNYFKIPIGSSRLGNSWRCWPSCIDQHYVSEAWRQCEFKIFHTRCLG